MKRSLLTVIALSGLVVINFSQTEKLSGKVLFSSADFNDPKFTGNLFFDKTVTFRGAIVPAGTLATWWKGWTKFNYN